MGFGKNGKKEVPRRFLELMRGIKHDMTIVQWDDEDRYTSINVLYKQLITGWSHFIGFEEPQRNPT